MNRCNQQFGRGWHGVAKVPSALALAWLLAGGVPAQEKPFPVDDLLKSVERWARENLDDDVLQGLEQVDRDRVRSIFNDLLRRFQGDSVYDLAALKETASALVPLLAGFEETLPYAEWLPTRLISSLTQWTNWTNLDAMKTVNVHEAKTHFSSLLAKLEKDSETIVICRNGEPVADLVPHQRVKRIKAHPLLSKIKIGYDPVEPLSSDEWPEAAR